MCPTDSGMLLVLSLGANARLDEMYWKNPPDQMRSDLLSGIFWE